jgi:hypothetical protein
MKDSITMINRKLAAAPFAVKHDWTLHCTRNCACFLYISNKCSQCLKWLLLVTRSAVRPRPGEPLPALSCLRSIAALFFPFPVQICADLADPVVIRQIEKEQPAKCPCVWMKMPHIRHYKQTLNPQNTPALQPAYRHMSPAIGTRRRTLSSHGPHHG